MTRFRKKPSTELESLDNLIIEYHKNKLLANKYSTLERKLRKQILNLMVEQSLETASSKIILDNGDEKVVSAVVKEVVRSIIDTEKLLTLIPQDEFNKIATVTKTDLNSVFGTQITDQVTKVVAGDKNVTIK